MLVKTPRVAGWTRSGVAALAARRRGWPPSAGADAVPMLPFGPHNSDRVDANDSGAAGRVTWLTADRPRLPLIGGVLAQLTAPSRTDSTAGIGEVGLSR